METEGVEVAGDREKGEEVKADKRAGDAGK